ncbi:MAG TPA: hypothetical protein DEA08_28860, partial [Planctomycetes bacterium]|nr:hypothetical protein [Planctomycetota bacterium]
LSQCGFNEDPHAYPWQTSDRGQKLAAFARALARDPSLVIVDRFFEGLEIPEWRRLFELVMELNQHQGVSWLLVSELDPAIFQVAERVAVLEEGELIAYDYRRKLYKDPRIKQAFEAGATRGQKTRTQRADRDRLRQVVADHSSERFEALSVESGSRLESESALDAPLDATIAIDGILPAPPAPLELSGSGDELEQSAAEGLDVTIYMGSSDERQALPKKPRARPRLRAPGTPPGLETVKPNPPRKRKKPSLRDATTIDQPPPPAGELAATVFYEPPSGEEPADLGQTALGDAPSTDEGEALPVQPPERRRARGLRPTVDLGATYVGGGSSALHDRPGKADQRTVEMEAPSIDELEGRGEAPTRSEAKPEKDARTVEMEAPQVEELEDAAPPPLAETKRLDPPLAETGAPSEAAKKKRQPALRKGESKAGKSKAGKSKTGKRKRPEGADKPGTRKRKRLDPKAKRERTVEMPAPSLDEEPAEEPKGEKPPRTKVELEDPQRKDEEA